MLEALIVILFVGISYYIIEKDNEDSELYKLLHKK